MEGRPAKEHLELLVGHITFKNFNVANRDDYRISAVRGVKMRRLMVAPINKILMPLNIQIVGIHVLLTIAA